MLAGQSGLLRVKSLSATPLPLLWVLRLLETHPELQGLPSGASVAAFPRAQCRRVPPGSRLTGQHLPPTLVWALLDAQELGDLGRK